MAQVSEYGTWKSPITSSLVSVSSVALQDVQLDSASSAPAGVVYWSECRFEEGGRYVVCSSKVNEDGFTAWTPEGFNARTRIHEYGGGSFFVYDGAVYFSNFQDQRLYIQKSATETPVALTPADCGWRYADMQFCAQLERILCVREDHSGIKSGATKEAANSIVSINPKDGSQTVLASGYDFYASPKVSPDASKIAWIQWNHPNMPWDSTELWVADLNQSGDGIVSGSTRKVEGGDVSLILPGWTNENELLYISDKSEWWNLYHVTSSGDHVNLSPQDVEIGGPQWEFSRYAYAVDRKPTGNIITSFDGEIGILKQGDPNVKKVDTGFNNHTVINYGKDDCIYCRAGSPTKFPCIVRINPQTGQVDIIRKSREVPVDEGYLSIPTELKWKTGQNAIAYGNYYPARNKDYSGPASSLPPVLVKAHGGPTGQSGATLNLKLQYFTSRGISVLDVNYRGSTGYGKSYRHALRKNWGIYDIEDCCSGAQFLVDSGRADPKRLCIDGGSAGGYTTLACLAFNSTFKAGVSHYGVADLEVLAKETHKFESRYLDSLIGPYPEMRQVYLDRSPIHHVDGFSCPVALFQGDEDEIVPPNQAVMMFDAVKAKGLPTALVMFKGEQHGFRKIENIKKALDGEFYFFSRVFGFKAADTGGEIDIENLK